jgi:DNA-binding beta-propeller fold protein YncE
MMELDRTTASGRREDAMTSNFLRHTVPFAMAVAAGVAAAWLFTADANAQQTRDIPTFAVDPSWPKVPPQWKLGDASSVAVDAQDNVYVLHRPLTLKPEDAAKTAPPVVVFDTAGNYIKSWGGPGDGFEWPEREHGIHVDHKGFAWIGGNNCPTSGVASLKPVADDALLKFTLDGKFVLQIGKSNQSKGDADTVNVHRAADAWVLPSSNELFVADGYGNHRVIVFDADTGAFKRTWGAFGKPPGGEDSCAIIGPKTFPEGEGLPHFNVAHAIRVANDGMVYLADRENRRVQMFTSDGKFVKQLVRTAAPFARDLALSPDPEQQFLYVGGGKAIAVVDRKTLDIVGEIEVPGQLGPGHHIATDSKGNIYIAQTTAGLQKLMFKGMSAPAIR